MSYFKVQEFVDPTTYSIRGQKSIQLIDCRLVVFMETLRGLLGVPITANNWHYGGGRVWSGLRTTKSPYYRAYSQHTFGRAIDFLVKGFTAAEVRKKIERWHAEGKFGDIQISMEYGIDISWVHVDIRYVQDLAPYTVSKFYVPSKN